MSTEVTATTAGAPQSAPATVVIEQRLRPGREEDFRAWQEGMNRAVAGFAGFLGTEVVPPVDETAGWTVLYRFDSKAHLETWLSSVERAAILERGADLFNGQTSQQVLMGDHDEGLVTVVVKHPVDPERVDEFLAWQERVTAAEHAYPGFRGAELHRPVPGVQEEWTALFRFDNAENLQAWLNSPERKTLLEEGKHFQDFELHRISSPFGSWFGAGDDASAPAPPDWKTALSVLVGLYPTVVLLTLGISELWPNGELWETLLLGNILSVSLLTWAVMPIVTRSLHFWLAPARGTASSRLDAIGAAASIGFLTVAATIFWAVTTQIWTLP